MAMTDPDPSEQTDPGRSRIGRLLGLARRPSNEAPETDALNGNGHPSEMRLRIARFEQASVGDVMIPRPDIVAIEIDAPLSEVLKVFAEESHSRLPVYRETLDDPAGFVHIKDVVAEIAKGCADDAKILDTVHREILYVPDSMPLADLLLKMQASRIHLALVVDEYGGTDGLVSLEDLVEEIVGDIEDEHDEEDVALFRRTRNVYEVDARMEIEDFQQETGHDLSLPEHEAEIDTLGGVAFALAGRIPVRGEVLRHPQGLDVEIVEADTRRIKRLRLRPTPMTNTAPDAD
ncbi:MAG: hemolysin family protein [Pseudomonadota bacterium]